MDTNREEGNMKKQYRITERHWPFYNIILYHDGMKVEVRDSDRIVIDMDINKLEREGYTYGYTDDEIEKARKAYEHMVENRIEGKIE